MNRPTRITFIGFIIVLAMTAFLTASKSDELQEATEASDQYNECVYFSAISQAGSNNNDISRSAEAAFKSCGTEYARVVALLRRAGLTDDQIGEVVLKKQAGIKAELRKMANEVQLKRANP